MAQAAKESAKPPQREGKKRLGANYLKLVGASGISNLGDGVGHLAYPWLATAVTRSPLLIALIAVVRGLPWLLVSLPAGVVVDRVDRKRLMVLANTFRTAITLGVVAAVTLAANLPAPEEIKPGFEPPSNLGLYLVLLIATLGLGIAEVFYDSAAVAFIPAVVDKDQLEKANGRLWSVEEVANSFIGPPLGAILILGGFATAFIFDAVSFAASAVLVGLITAQGKAKRAQKASTSDSGPDAKPNWRGELREGVRWLRQHEFLWPLAISLGLCNLLFAAMLSSYVLFAQEVLQTSSTEFALLGTAGAFGGVIGGWTASRVIKKLGTGPTLNGAIATGGLLPLAVAFTSWWPAVWLFMGTLMAVFTVWNVLTVSLRQRIIPDELLGRVNSVYRFVGLGIAPFGALLGGVVVVVIESSVDRNWGLRAPWFVGGIGYMLVLIYTVPRLTTSAITKAEQTAESDPDKVRTND